MLPILDTPKYTSTLPSSKIDFEYRPLLVKEEKLFMLNENTKNKQELLDVIHQVVDNCTFNSMNIKSLPLIDIEYILLLIRTSGKGNIIRATVQCNSKDENGQACNHKNQVELDLNQAKASTEESIDGKVELTDTVGVKIKMPGFDGIANIMETDNELDVIIGMVEYIWDESNIYKSEDHTSEEISAFFDSMTETQLKEISKVINKMPHLKIDAGFKCEKCGYTEDIEFKDLFDFLA